MCGLEGFQQVIAQGTRQGITRRGHPVAKVQLLPRAKRQTAGLEVVSKQSASLLANARLPETE